MPVTNFDATTPQLKVVKEWFDTFSSLDANRHPPASKNFKYQTLPKAADLPGEEAKEQLAERFRGMLSTLAKMEVDVHEVIEAPGKVVVHITAVCSTVDGSAFNYDSICIFTLVEEDGELKVLHCKDFSDNQQRSAIITRTGALKGTQ